MTVVGRNGSQDHLSDDAVNELRTRLRGQVVVVPEDPDARTEPGTPGTLTAALCSRTPGSAA